MHVCDRFQQMKAPIGRETKSLLLVHKFIFDTDSPRHRQYNVLRRYKRMCIWVSLSCRYWVMTRVEKNLECMTLSGLTDDRIIYSFFKHKCCLDSILTCFFICLNLKIITRSYYEFLRLVKNEGFLMWIIWINKKINMKKFFIKH